MRKIIISILIVLMCTSVCFADTPFKAPSTFENSLEYNTTIPFKSGTSDYLISVDGIPIEWAYLYSACKVAGYTISSKSSTTYVAIISNLSDEAIQVIRNYGNVSGNDGVYSFYFPSSLISELQTMFSNSTSGSSLMRAYDSSRYNNIPVVSVFNTRYWDSDINDGEWQPCQLYVFSLTSALMTTSTFASVGYLTNNTMLDIHQGGSTSTITGTPYIDRTSSTLKIVYNDIYRNFADSSANVSFTVATPLTIGRYNIPLTIDNNLYTNLKDMDISPYLEQVTPPTPSLDLTFEGIKEYSSSIFEDIVDLFNTQSIYFYILCLFVVLFVARLVRRILQ